MFFYDETQSVSQKFNAVHEDHTRRISNTPNNTQITALKIATTFPSDFINYGPTDQICQTLGTSYQDVALYFFVQRTGVYSSRKYISRFLQEAGHALRSASPSSPIIRVVAAVGLAWLAEEKRLQVLRAKALAEYGNALRLLTTAMQDSSKTTTDEMPLAVILLTIYEIFASARNWSPNFLKHTTGALTLLRYRGAAQFKDPRNVRLFRSIRSYVVINSIISLEDFEADPFWTGDCDEPSEPLDKLVVVIMRLPSLRVRSKSFSKTPRSETSEALAKQLINEALILDKELQQWCHELRKNYHYVDIPCRDASVISSKESNIDHYRERWKPEVHKYDDFLATVVVNKYRIARLYAQEVIQDCVAHLPTTTSPSTNTTILDFTNSVVERMSDEICASLPYHIDSNMTENAKTWQYPPPGFKELNTGEVYFMVFPLNVVANVRGIPEMQRTWVERQLKLLLETYGQRLVDVFSGDRPFQMCWG